MQWERHWRPGFSGSVPPTAGRPESASRTRQLGLVKRSHRTFCFCCCFHSSFKNTLGGGFCIHSLRISSVSLKPLAPGAELTTPCSPSVSAAHAVKASATGAHAPWPAGASAPRAARFSFGSRRRPPRPPSRRCPGAFAEPTCPPRTEPGLGPGPSRSDAACLWGGSHCRGLASWAALFMCPVTLCPCP